MKPRLYHIDNKSLICASEIKALIQLTKNIEINYQASFNHLFFNGFPSKNDILFAGIQSLAPGTLLKFDFETKMPSSLVSCDLKSFVNESAFNENAALSRNELTETFGNLFRNFVEAHLLSDVPVAVL